MEGAKSASILVDLALPVLLRPRTKRNKKHQMKMHTRCSWLLMQMLLGSFMAS
jgi:hypothetical protein